MEKQLKADMARAEKLTQAVSSKAFQGELVMTEPELARREGHSYESIFQLPARIKSEREAGKKTDLGNHRRVDKKKTH